MGDIGDRLAEIEARLMFTNDGQTDTDDVPALLAGLRGVLALHERVTRWGNEDYSISQDRYDDERDDVEDGLTPFDVCAECFRIEQTSDQHDGAECEHAVLDGLWPCPTAAAITAALGVTP